MIVLSFSITIGDEDECLFKRTESKTGALCGTIAPYTFMFYLWHSILLSKVANKLTIDNLNTHYFAMLALGFTVTACIAYLFTNMNNGVTKQILKK